MPIRVPGPTGYYSNEEQGPRPVTALAVAIGDHQWPYGVHVARRKGPTVTSLAADVTTGLDNPGMRIYEAVDFHLDMFSVDLVVLDVTAQGRKERNALVRHVETTFPQVPVHKIRIGERRTELTSIVRAGRPVNRTDLFEPFLYEYRRGNWRKSQQVHLNHEFTNALETYQVRPRTTVEEEEEWRVDESDSWVVPLALAVWALNPDQAAEVHVPKGSKNRGGGKRRLEEPNTEQGHVWVRDLNRAVAEAEREHFGGGSGPRIGRRAWEIDPPGPSSNLPDIGT